MQNSPFVSIITVVFNSKNTVESTIRSVLRQSYQNIEYIIIDGGSTDGTVEVVGKYKDEITKIVSEPDRGIYDGMNKGMRLASGDIVGILNSDDFYADDEVIEEVVKIMEDKNVDVCWGDLVYVSPKDTNKIVRYWKSSEYKEGKFKKGWMPAHPTFFVRRRVYEKYGIFNLNFPIAGDYELMLRILEKYKVKSCHIPKVLVKMRAGGSSNKNIIRVIKGDLECYRAWKVNGLKISFLEIWSKPFSE
ncbi:unnamed protein product [marine sediment metagenome]|uniref:Glycosyltransferase 2-like domain-containing protein n=1 Tax=marine sediment metagenome TaxID=412755 RepID=X1NEY9_9ZZZZ